MASRLTVVDHPVVQEKLARLRDKHTRPEEFRQLMGDVSMLLGYEALRTINTRRTMVQTPLRTAQAEYLEDPVCVVGVLRAGLGMMDGVIRLAPDARMGHIGLYRNEESLNPVRYYVRLPKDIAECTVILCDPMLATGGSAVEAINILKTDGARHIILVTLLSSKAGVKRVHEAHPSVQIVTAAVDAQLNRMGYIVPGLGDAGDRLFATT